MHVWLELRDVTENAEKDDCDVEVASEDCPRAAVW